MTSEVLGATKGKPIRNIVISGSEYQPDRSRTRNFYGRLILTIPADILTSLLQLYVAIAIHGLKTP